MKNLSILFLIIMSSFSLTGFSQATEESTDQETIDEAVVEVYYFHFTRRCATCQAVEDESKAALEVLYPEELESGKILFIPINLEEEANEEFAMKMKIAGQSLLVVKGEEKIDLTSDGFKYARSNPEKLQASLKDTIDPML